MNKFCTIVSIALSVACFAYMFNSDIILSCVFGIIAFLISFVGFLIESKAPYYWNTKLNKVLYFLSKKDKEYNIDSKEFTYTCMQNNEYKSEKVYYIRPTCNNLDRITERFAWSAPSSKAIISPIINGHEITATWQQELWTYYSVYFHHTCKKNKVIQTGSIISNLIDNNHEVVPFLSATVDRKTKLLIMRICFENIEAPPKATFKVCSVKNPSKEIYTEELVYDSVIKGFSISVNFPRQNWKYVISW